MRYVDQFISDWAPSSNSEIDVNEQVKEVKMDDMSNEVNIGNEQKVENMSGICQANDN